MFSPTFPAMQDAGEQIREAQHLLLSVVFDGTLAPIVDHPARAVFAAPMKRALGALARRHDVSVAVVSGRGLDELQDYIGLPEVICVGNHGLEIRGPGLDFVEPAAHAASGELHQLADKLTEELRRIPGALVEDKGLSTSVHYRRVAPIDGEEVWHVVHNAVAALDDRFHVTLGDKVYEIRPLVRWTKGAAIRWIKNQIEKPNTQVVYVGTDADEDAYCILGDEAITIRVGESADSAAQYLLPDCAALERLLHWMGELREEKRHLAAAV